MSLEASQESARGGDNVNFTCTVLGEPEVDVSFTWSYPGQVREILCLKLKSPDDTWFRTYETTAGSLCLYMKV